MNASRVLWFVTAAAILVFITSCGKTSAPQRDKPSNFKVNPQASADDQHSVLFDIKPSSASSGHYDCTYSAEGKTAKFGLQFKQDRPITLGEGKFVAVAGSENSILLRDLTKALDGKRIPHPSMRVKELAFDAVVLGENLSRTSDGFSDNPRGNWTAIKISLPRDGDDGEVFLNLNIPEGKGQFSIKDSDYADYLLNEFAKVL